MSYEKEESPVEMNRRRFLQSSVLGGALSLMSPLLSRAAEPLSASSQMKMPAFEFEEITIAGLQAGMSEGRWTAREVAKKYLSRIEEIDRRGPSLNSVIELNLDALQIAE